MTLSYKSKRLAQFQFIRAFAIQIIKPKRQIKKFCNIFVFTGLMLLSSDAFAKTTKVLLYGDSISAGYGMTTPESWPYLLNETFKSEQQPIRLINESISGETTGGGLARLPQVLKRHALAANDWLLIELGGNDGLRGFPINGVKSNLTQMIELAKSQGIKVAIMQIRIPPNYGKRYTNLFESQYPQLAEKFSIPLLPFFMEKIALNPNYMLNDGIHPNVSAQIIIRDMLKTEIEQLIND